MRKIVMVTAMAVSVGVMSLVSLTNAEARFGAGTIAEASAGGSTAQPAQYYGGYRYGYRRYYGPRYYGYKNSRDALNTCAYC